MSNPLTFRQKQYIKKHSELGEKSAVIALQLNISIWTVRKWRGRIKKGA